MPAQRETNLHESVMSDEVCEFLSPCLCSGTVVDATVGDGGHVRRLVEAAQSRFASIGRVLGMDLDPEALVRAWHVLRLEGLEVKSIVPHIADESCLAPIQRGIVLIHSSYTEMERVVDSLQLRPVTGVLFDFGVSLHQLTAAERGFSHNLVGDADMRFDQTGTDSPAWKLLQGAAEREIAEWLWRFGDEPSSRRIARRLCQERGRVRTTEDIARIVAASVPASRVRRSLGRVFLALRIAVNRELEAVGRGLAAALRLLEVGGRLVAISYHSGEDALVKSALRDGLRVGRLQLLTHRCLRPTLAEVERNPRGRSARLRAAEVIA